MNIRELAQKACLEQRERRQENNRQSNINAAEDALRVLKSTLRLELGPDDVRLDPPYIVVDELRFSYHFDDETGTEFLQLVQMCPKCGRQYKANVYDMETLGVALESKNGHGCFKQLEDYHPICPVISSMSADDGELYAGCAGDRCAWWDRCQGTASISELSMVVETKAEQPAAPPQWAYLELMGHDTIVGQVSEGQIAGATMIRVDVPALDERPGYTRYLGRSAIFRLTPIDEAKAQAMLAFRHPGPDIPSHLLPPELRSEPRVVLHAGDNGGYEDDGLAF